MPQHRIGSRKEWQVARDELAKLERTPKLNPANLAPVMFDPPSATGQIGIEMVLKRPRDIGERIERFRPGCRTIQPC